MDMSNLTAMLHAVPIEPRDLLAASLAMVAFVLGVAIGIPWGRRRERYRGILAYAPDSEFTAKASQPVGRSVELLR